MMKRWVDAVLVLLLAAAAVGCVERKLFIATVPAEADVYLDGHYVGKSPVTVPFTHYGTREIVVRKAGYEVVREEKILEPPPFQEFPWDLYYETLTSDLYIDERPFSFVLTPIDPAEMTREVVDVKMAEAKEIRER
ncbi:MAG: PEGA domain-containing protein [Planctomycetes bacterium]|nr:PEGA domain-containing protein [Planctomycetota bacterium]